ncbi:MAG: hypothetical protein PHV05_05070 [Candidatus Riflebacteria bacterium]|nr:hypothetical protein [Candidatus Riflebacteria bacterium]
MVEKCENSAVSTLFSFFTGKIEQFSDELRCAARTVWNRKNFQGIYSSVDKTASKFIGELRRELADSNLGSNGLELSIVVAVCVFAFTFVKTGNVFSSKLKIRISDICLDILCDYCDEPEDVFDVVCRIVDKCRGGGRESEIMKSIFGELTGVCHILKHCPVEEGALLCRDIRDDLRTEFERYY